MSYTNISFLFLENWSIFVLTICLLEVFISLLAFIYCCLALCWKGFVIQEDQLDQELPQPQFTQEMPYSQQHDSPQVICSVSNYFHPSNALCSRKFQNVKLRLVFIEV